MQCWIRDRRFLVIALKNVALGTMLLGLLVVRASAAPLSTGVSGDWQWWSQLYSSPVTSTWDPSQFALSFYGPPGRTLVPTTPNPVPASPPSTQLLATTFGAASPAPAVSTPPASAPVADAYINLGAGPYPLESRITTGNAQPWYDSAPVTGFFGGQQPNAQQISAFTSTVLQRVEQAFQKSGVSVNLTTDPSVTAAHTLSLVSNTTSNTNPGVIGMTQIGGSGFSFVDQEARSAQSLDQLEWIVAHNISHELMLAFGVGENYDQTGQYIDARNANWSMMVDPNASFSTGAAQALDAALSSSHTVSTEAQGAQLLQAQSVPEPTTLVGWALALSAGWLIRRKRSGSP
jgi:hypothetical protein